MYSILHNVEIFSESDQYATFVGCVAPHTHTKNTAKTSCGDAIRLPHLPPPFLYSCVLSHIL